MAIHLLRLAIAACFCVAFEPAQAQSAPHPFPTGPVRIIVPAPAGGSTDVVARILAQSLSVKWGAVIVENRTGAGGNLGVGVAARQPADGNAILLTSSHFLINPSLYGHLGWDPVKDFEAVTNVANSPNAIAVHTGVAARSVGELVALVKAEPGKFSYASPGAGSSQNLTCELIRQRAALQWEHIPYNGGGPVVTAVLGGQVPLTCMSLPPLLPYVSTGKLRILAVTSATRSPALPSVPTMAEAGFPDVVTEQIQGLFVPAGTPRAVVDKIYADVVSAMRTPEMAQKMTELGNTLVLNKPEEFSAFVKEERKRWFDVIKQGGIHAE